MRIREGDPLEIYTDRDGEVIFKKYSPLGDLSILAGEYIAALHKAHKVQVIVCDKDAVIAVAGAPEKELLERRISLAMEDLLECRKFFAYGDGLEQVSPVEGVDKLAITMEPIIGGGDVYGVILIVEETGHLAPARDVDTLLCKVAASYLGTQLAD